MHVTPRTRIVNVTTACVRTCRLSGLQRYTFIDVFTGGDFLTAHQCLQRLRIRFESAVDVDPDAYDAAAHTDVRRGCFCSCSEREICKKCFKCLVSYSIV